MKMTRDLETDGKFKIGVDAKYGITSNLTARCHL